MCALANDRWRALSQYLDRVLELDDTQRVAWLDSLAVEQPSIAEELRGLLADHEALSRRGFLEDAAGHVPPGSLAGTTVGAYVLVSPIGQGGMVTGASA